MCTIMWHLRIRSRALSLGHPAMNRGAEKCKGAEAPFRVLAFFSLTIHRQVIVQRRIRKNNAASKRKKPESLPAFLV